MSHLQDHADGVNFRGISWELGETPASAFRHHGCCKQPNTNKATSMRAMSLKETPSAYRLRMRQEVLPWLDDAMGGPLSRHHQQLVSVLGLARIEAFLPGGQGLPGRPHVGSQSGGVDSTLAQAVGLHIERRTDDGPIAERTMMRRQMGRRRIEPN